MPLGNHCKINKEMKMGKKAKEPQPISIAKIGLIGVVVAAVIGSCGTIIAAYIGYLGIKAQLEKPILTSTATQTSTTIATPSPEVIYAVVTETTENDPWIASFPVVGTQLNFAPNLSLNENIEDLPSKLRMTASPFAGIFLGHMEGEVPTSWEVHYKDGEILPAQTDKCYINLGYEGVWQSPLNLRANEISSSVAIFVDYRYSMIIKSIEVFLTEYKEPKATSEIEFVRALMPGAGGMGYPFQTVRANRVFIDKDLSEAYQIDFQDFILRPQEGVDIHIPITLVSQGSYQLQIKVIGQAIPVFNGDKEGDFTLTTGRFSYSWVNIEEPLDFIVEQITSSDNKEADLTSCP